MDATKALSIVDRVGVLVGEIDSLTQQLLALRSINADLRAAMRDVAAELEAEAVRHERVAREGTPYWSPDCATSPSATRAVELRTLAKRLRAIEVSR